MMKKKSFGVNSTTLIYICTLETQLIILCQFLIKSALVSQTNISMVAKD